MEPAFIEDGKKRPCIFKIKSSEQQMVLFNILFALGYELWSDSL